MGRKAKVGIVVVAFMLVMTAVAVGYDSSRKETIAEGVAIGGVDVGGLEPQEAERKVRRQLLAPLRRSLEVRFEGRSWRLPGEQLKLRADLDEAVQEALEASRDGGLPARLIRYLGGGDVEERIGARISYSKPAINRFVRRIAGDIDREPRDATVEASGDSLSIVPARWGRKLRDNLLTKQLTAAVTNADAAVTIAARTRKLAPEVKGSELPDRYPTYLTLDRASYELRLWKNLRLAKTYTVAVGQEGLETPEGLYSIQNKEVEPSWHVPESDWAGDLAGQVIPPGPENPLKARWMGIFDGAGIHGTEDTGSLGSAASHGCVRMSVPDVIELYDQVEVGTPIYIG